MQKIKSRLKKIKKHLAERLIPPKSQPIRRFAWSTFFVVSVFMIFISGALIMYIARGNEKEFAAEAQSLKNNYIQHVVPEFLERVKRRNNSQKSASKQD